jgi:spermidine/putrescine transport system substrate-binding protein
MIDPLKALPGARQVILPYSMLLAVFTALPLTYTRRKFMQKWLIILWLLWIGTGYAEDNLVIYNWSEYLPQQVIDQFTEETGIDIQYATYDSNEAMYAKVKTVQGEGYDLLVPSTYYVDRMRREGLLQKLDKSRLSNFGNLNPRLLNQPYDPDNNYSIPYLWGTTGIAINTDRVDPDKVVAWEDLWDSSYENKLLLLNDVREVFSMGLKTLGYSANSTNEEEIRAAYEKLAQLMPNVRVFNAESPKDLFLAEEVILGMNWNGEVYMANQENPSIRYIYPKEGVTVWMDNFVLSKRAKNVDAAYQFIDFILRPDIAKIITEEIGYTSPNLEAVKLLPESLRNNRIVYPTEEDLKNAEFQTDVGQSLPVYEKYWQRLKSGG